MSSLQSQQYDPYNFTADYAVRIGSDHRKAFSNNMDAAHLKKGFRVVVGGVADGCGGTGEHSEVGALLFIPWLVERLHALLETSSGTLTGMKISDAVAQLWSEYIPKLQQILDLRFSGITKSLDMQREACNAFLLHTVVMYVAIYDSENGYWDLNFVYRGDGYLVVDNQLINLEGLSNHNFRGVVYPALALRCYNGRIPDPKAVELASAPFDVIHAGNSRDNWTRIAVGTDGLRYLMESHLDRVVFPEYKIVDKSTLPPGVKVVSALTESLNWAIRDVYIAPADDISFVNFITFPPAPPESESISVEEPISTPVPTPEEMAGEVSIDTSNQETLNVKPEQNNSGDQSQPPNSDKVIIV